MKRLALIVCCWLLLPTFVSASTPPKPLASCELPGGATLSLMWGISHQMYWPTGQDGRVGEKIAQGHFQGRKFMAEHEGDWCLFRLMTADSVTNSRPLISLDDNTRIIIDFVGYSVSSTHIVSVDGPAEDRLYASGIRWFNPGIWPLMSPMLGGWPLYVRFPEGSCLTSKPFPGSDSGRAFRAQPLAIRIEGGE